MKPANLTILTVREVAAYLRLHVVTVYRMAQHGALPAFRVGRGWRFKRDQIDQWLLDRQIGNAMLVPPAAKLARGKGRRR